METLIQSKRLKKPKALSEKQIAAGNEFLLARFLHDRFCKFEAFYHAPTAINTIRAIKLIIDPEILRDADLSFKLNNLRWFLTRDGKKFLLKQEKRHLLDQKLAILDLEKENVQKQINEIAKETSPCYDKKVGEDRVFKKEIKSISEFLD